MELYNEKIQERKSKIPMFIGICIVVLVIITMFIFFGIIYLKNSITIIQIDGERNDSIENILYKESTEDGLKLYIPIIKIAQYLDYEGFTGDYKEISEDKTKCHVKSDLETAMFTLNSDVIVKINEDTESENIKIDKAVFEKDGELYTTIEGIEKAFNVKFSYDDNFKNINIYTMDYLVKSYAKKLEISKYSTNFADKKAILENMIIMQDNNGQYGVIDVRTGESILETKYEMITFLPTTKHFLIKANGKYGIMTKEADVKIKAIYEDITMIDNKNELYLVKQNQTYGILNSKGEVIIEPEYISIGIDVSEFEQNGVDSNYVFLDEIIPVKNKDGLWGFFNVKGEQITEFKYTALGCTSAPVTNSYPALVISNQKIMVVKKDEYYNLITTEGKELISANIVDSVYLKTDVAKGENKFFMTSNNYTKVINIEEWLTNIGR